MDEDLDSEPEFPTEEEARAALARRLARRRQESPSISSLKLADGLDYAADFRPAKDEQA
jgi:hypothetical protein